MGKLLTEFRTEVKKNKFWNILEDSYLMTLTAYFEHFRRILKKRCKHFEKTSEKLERNINETKSRNTQENKIGVPV